MHPGELRGQIERLWVEAYEALTEGKPGLVGALTAMKILGSMIAERMLMNLASPVRDEPSSHYNLSTLEREGHGSPAVGISKIRNDPALISAMATQAVDLAKQTSPEHA